MAKGYPDFEGNKSGLYLIPEWAAFEAADKNFNAYLADVVTGGGASVDYAVPTGKTLYITQLSFSMWGNLAADRDNNQICVGALYDLTAAAWLWYQGGNGGGSAPFPKPIVIAAGTTVRLYCINHANHNGNCSVTAGGYEL